MPLIIMLALVLAWGTISAQAEQNTARHKIICKATLPPKPLCPKNTVVTPTLKQSIKKGRNVVWCGSFQLAWNELKELCGGDVELSPPTRKATILNAGEFSKTDLDPDSFVAMAGLAKDHIIDKIRIELENKFNGKIQTPLLDRVEKDTLSPSFVAYACLYKNLPFKIPLARRNGELNFYGCKVDAFGISDGGSTECREQVQVVDYKDYNDFIVSLRPKNNEDTIIIAKMKPAKTLAATWEAVEKRISEATPETMGENDELMIPVLKFDARKNYSGLCGRAIASSNQAINGRMLDMAAQVVKFQLNEHGARLFSEALCSDEAFGNRQLIVNKPFLLVLKRKESVNPYLILWVGNAGFMKSRRGA